MTEIPKNVVNLIGFKNPKSRLEVLRYGGKEKYHFWICHCDCDKNEKIRKEIKVYSKYLINGDTKSCGCLKHEPYAQTHGMRNSSEYEIWCGMKKRCNNPKCEKYKYYGGRGVTYCERWEKFENFIEDMKEKPEPKEKYSLDRFPDMNGNYEPENCRWATKEEQTNNARSNVKLTHDGETLNVSQWAVKLGVSANTLYSRVNLNWSTEDILTKPIKNRKNKNNE